LRFSGSGSPVGADAEDPAADDPAADDPAADDPAADDPAADDPAADDPAAGPELDDPAPVDPAAEDPAAEDPTAGLELDDPAPVAGAPLEPDPGFCVEAPQAATIPATASAATIVATRDMRDIEGLPSVEHWCEFMGPARRREPAHRPGGPPARCRS
jgi:hypothetical protein